jgi:hypothetical protein
MGEGTSQISVPPQSDGACLEVMARLCGGMIFRGKLPFRYAFCLLFDRRPLKLV